MTADGSSPISSLVPELESAQGYRIGPRQNWLTGTNPAQCQASAHGNPKPGPRYPHEIEREVNDFHSEWMNSPSKTSSLNIGPKHLSDIL